MIILFFLIIPTLYALIKLVLYFVVKKYGRFSYDGFGAAGFAYHSEKDIFYSTKNAWQKNFGYTHAYDVFAPIFQMIIDTEPVRFFYNNKNWLITFWKGQYGIVTGAEIGVYCTKQRIINKRTIYLPVSDNELLNMGLVLYKNGEMIMKAKAKHWWLAIFKLGLFSKPKELWADAYITFPNEKMLEAFLNAFKKIGYSKKDYKVIDKTFVFRFKKPKSRKVWTRNWLVDSIRQHYNRKNVKLYNKYLADFIDDNYIDDTKKSENSKVIILNDFLPDLIKNAPENNKNSKQVAKKIYNEKEKNVVFINNNDKYEGTENKPWIKS